MSGQTGWGRSLASSPTFGGIMIEPIPDKLDKKKYEDMEVTLDEVTVLRIGIRVLREKINEIIEHINNA